MYLTFPKFAITHNISEDGDLRIPLEQMTVEDWGIPNYVLDGIDCCNNDLGSYKGRLDLMNGLLKDCAITTRANRKE